MVAMLHQRMDDSGLLQCAPTMSDLNISNHSMPKDEAGQNATFVRVHLQQWRRQRQRERLNDGRPTLADEKKCSR